MKKGFLNLVLFLLIGNSLYNIIIKLTLPPLCPEEGLSDHEKCRFYDLITDEVDDYSQPIVHEDSDKYFKSIRAWFIPTVIYYFLMLSIGISYFVAPKKHKKLFAYIAVGAMILNSLLHIIVKLKEPPMCPIDDISKHKKCVNHDLFAPYFDAWLYPIRHPDSYDFHRQRMGLKLGEIIGYGLFTLLSIFTLIKK